jgi:hypothetical protein
MAKLDMKKAMKDLLNEGGSIFGELSEGTKKMEELKTEVKTVGEKEPQVYILGKFEVRATTKKHKSPYVTFTLDGEIVSGYGTAVGNKLMKIAKAFGKVDGNHYHMEEGADLEVTFTIGTSDAGEYLDIHAVE